MAQVALQGTEFSMGPECLKGRDGVVFFFETSGAQSSIDIVDQ